MGTGSYLRTNYRKTGGILDITAIGGGIPAGVAQGQSGPTDMYGGLVYITSFSGRFNTASAASYCFEESTYGLLSFFYGANSPGSGYLFRPLGINWVSISDVAFSAGAQSLAVPGPFRVTFSSSLFQVKVAKNVNVLGSGIPSYRSFSGEQFLCDVWGLIISGP